MLWHNRSRRPSRLTFTVSNCGHVQIEHEGHVDYLDEGKLCHQEDGGRVTEHVIPVSKQNPAACTPVMTAANMNRDTFTVQAVATRQSRMAITWTTWSLGISIIRTTATATITGRLPWPVRNLTCEQSVGCQESAEFD